MLVRIFLRFNESSAGLFDKIVIIRIICKCLARPFGAVSVVFSFFRRQLRAVAIKDASQRALKRLDITRMPTRAVTAVLLGAFFFEI